MFPRLKNTYLHQGAIFYDNKEFNELLRCLDTDIEMGNLLSHEIIEGDYLFDFLIHLDVYNCINIIKHTTLRNFMPDSKYKYIISLCFVFILCNKDSGNILSSDLSIIPHIHNLMNQDNEVLDYLVFILTQYQYSKVSEDYNHAMKEADAEHPTGIPETYLQNYFDNLMEDLLKIFISIVKILKILNIYNNNCEEILYCILNVFITTVTHGGVELYADDFSVTSEDYLKNMLVIYYSSDTMRSCDSLYDMLSDIARNHIYNR